MSKTDYVKFLNSFLKNEYKFIFFDELKTNKFKQIILRHDIDFDPYLAYQMAKLEKISNIKSTYFFLIRSNIYNAFSEKNVKIINKIKELGHRISLHFDPTLYSNIDEGLKIEISLFEKIFKVKINLISYHRPSKDIINNINSNSKVSTAYDPIFFSKIKYFSDSSGEFKYGDPRNSEEFSEKKNLQILIHPIWWIYDKKDRMKKLELFRKNKELETHLDLENNLNFYGK